MQTFQGDGKQLSEKKGNGFAAIDLESTMERILLRCGRVVVSHVMQSIVLLSRSHRLTMQVLEKHG